MIQFDGTATASGPRTVTTKLVTDAAFYRLTVEIDGKQFEAVAPLGAAHNVVALAIAMVLEAHK